MNDTFTALDFETAHPKRWSICQVGIVRIENGKVAEKVSILVQPPDNFYWDRFIDIHGITPTDTEGAATFNLVWKEIERYIKGQNVVAHNGFAFDFPVLKHTLEYYNLDNPKFKGHCTYKIYGENLKSVCTKHRIALNHHDALSDAMACAQLYYKHLRENRKGRR